MGRLVKSVWLRKSTTVRVALQYGWNLEHCTQACCNDGNIGVARTSESDSLRKSAGTHASVAMEWGRKGKSMLRIQILIFNLVLLCRPE